MTEVPCAELYYFIWCCALHLRRHWPAEAAPALSRCARTCRSDVILIIFIRAHGRDALTRRILDTRIFFFLHRLLFASVGGHHVVGAGLRRALDTNARST